MTQLTPEQVQQWVLPRPKHRGPDGTGSYFDSWTADQMHEAFAAGEAAVKESLTVDAAIKQGGGV